MTDYYIVFEKSVIIDVCDDITTLYSNYAAFSRNHRKAVNKSGLHILTNN